jgi:hypothetical protein
MVWGFTLELSDASPYGLGLYARTEWYGPLWAGALP